MDPTSYTLAVSGQYIDEVRFYPSYAQMETYTHSPLFGVTSITNINNRTTEYVYDELGRLVQVIDADGNIIQEYEYKIVQ